MISVEVLDPPKESHPISSEGPARRDGVTRVSGRKMKCLRTDGQTTKAPNRWLIVKTRQAYGPPDNMKPECFLSLSSGNYRSNVLHSVSFLFLSLHLFGLIPHCGGEPKTSYKVLKMISVEALKPWQSSTEELYFIQMIERRRKSHVLFVRF